MRESKFSPHSVFGSWVGKSISQINAYRMLGTLKEQNGCLGYRQDHNRHNLQQKSTSRLHHNHMKTPN